MRAWSTPRIPSSHVTGSEFRGSNAATVPAKTSTVRQLYWSTAGHYYRNLRDNHPLETIYPLLRHFPYTATANYLDRKVAQSLEKKNRNFTTGIERILELVSFV